ncbi:MAG: anhydro-N-acetylmuramic acid kinase [Crocinitomicaceae bacterium]
MKKNTRHKLQIIGLMSGTSLDGLDIACCTFEFTDETVGFEITHAKTVAYPLALENLLRSATLLKSEDLCFLDKQLGLFFAQQVTLFMEDKQLKIEAIDAIASHGHTVFHQPNRGFTLQIGCGATIALKTGIKVINDFRTKDVLMGGQGAPLVPIGDFDLFRDQADGFLNLGGFSNISLKRENSITAYDICPCNLPLNLFSGKMGFSFDEGGKLAKSGVINQKQLEVWDSLTYYNKLAPKSLGTEWLEEYFYAHFDSSISLPDALRTCVRHIVNQVTKEFNNYNLNRVLVTGGGAKNDFLISQMLSATKTELVIPDKIIVDFKEALIFAYLGALFLQGKPNNVPSVTGARAAVCGGTLHLPL